MQNKIYLDNAATTALDPEVLEAMIPFLTHSFGNPSSTHSIGRETKMAIENARKQVAKLLNAKPGEIIFTSGGTESNNAAFHAAIVNLVCTHIITSPIEHHAVLHTAERYVARGQASMSPVKVKEDGHIDLENLEIQLRNTNKKTLVSLMNANNEIGNITDLEAVGNLCKQYNAVFHSDCVQTVGHYPLNLQKINVQFISAAAHKFHGPKGTGILYIKEGTPVIAMITGGGQERNRRAGTENVAGIVGFAKALELAMLKYDNDSRHIQSLKTHMIERLNSSFTSISYNGDPHGKSLYTVLNVAFPKNNFTEMLLVNMDMNGVCASGGSACSSGQGSHVISAIRKGAEKINIRFSFNRHNTKQEMDTTINVLKKILHPTGSLNFT